MGSYSTLGRARSLPRQILDELIATNTFRRFRHLKRGTSYIEIGCGEVQSDRPIHEGDVLVVYIGEDGKIWLRPEGEFDDGRFQPVIHSERHTL